MRQLLEAVAAWTASDLRMVAATLVRYDGSTPRQLGLAVVVSESGDTVGALSGGCVDAEVVLACDRVLAGGPAEVLTFGTDDDGAQLVCGGVITVWVHDLDSTALEVLLDTSDAVAITERRGERIQHSAVTLQRPTGYQCDSSEDPFRAPAARWLLESGRRAELLDEADGTQIFLETFGRRRSFVIVGSSGYTEALCAQARLLGYETAVVEPRPRFAAGITFADTVIGGWPDVALEQLAQQGRLDDHSAIVVCTHDPKFDEPALLAALQTSAGFIGAMGSRTTTAERLSRLRAHGVAESELQRIHAPVGLDLGGECPAETAVSVVAQIISVARGRSAAPLRNTFGPLHAP